MRIKIKPLSVNAAWKGRRYRTDEYRRYTRNVLMMLPKINIPEGPYMLIIEFGFSSAASDLDNGLKPIIDILQKKYRFNDKEIHEIHARKQHVKKGEEYIEWELRQLD